MRWYALALGFTGAWYKTIHESTFVQRCCEPSKVGHERNFQPQARELQIGHDLCEKRTSKDGEHLWNLLVRSTATGIFNVAVSKPQSICDRRAQAQVRCVELRLDQLVHPHFMTTSKCRGAFTLQNPPQAHYAHTRYFLPTAN